MSIIEDYFVQTVAGVSSAAIIAAAVWIKGGRGPKTDAHGQHLIVIGDDNTVVQNPPAQQVERVRERVIERHITAAATTDDDTTAFIVGLLLAAVALVLAYLAALPLLVPAIVGASLAVGVVSLSMFRNTPSGAGPRTSVFVFGVVQALVMASTIWLRSNPLAGGGILALEGRLTRSVPGYGEGVIERGRALLTSATEVLSTLGLEGIVGVLVDVLALESCGVLILLQVMHLIQWRAFVRVGNGVVQSDADLARADAFRRLKHVAVGAWLVAFSAMAVFAASGYPMQWVSRALP